MKNKLLTITTSAFIGTTLFAGVAFADSIKVQKGHTLYNIANQYNVNVADIKKMNNLTSNNIFIGQTINLSKTNTSTKVSSPAKNTNKETTPVNSTHVVKKGDTLYSISKKNKISVSNIQSYNNLKSNSIHIGQVLKLGNVTISKPVEKVPIVEYPIKVTPIKKPVSTTTYTVKKGDTLFNIGSRFGVSYQTIKKWNALKSDSIYIGQKLSVTNSKATTPNIEPPTNTVVIGNNRSQLIAYAHSFTGTPYLWGGSNPGGFDCSGYIYYVLKSQNLVSSRTTVAGYWSQAKKIDTPQVGDLVFFENTYTSGPSHMGIYLGNGDFIHASSTNGVQINNVSSNYYASHLLGYATFY